MIPIEPFTTAVRELGSDLYTGVPCSYLGAFISYASDSGKIQYTAMTNEGDAIGLAVGSYLAGRLAIVLLQNSGLGNCVNPLTSLAMPYEIPMLLFVSHRGEGGRDAPQHLVMGAVMHDLLRTLRIPVFTLSPHLSAAVETMKQATATALSLERPVAVVVPKQTFEPIPYNGSLSQKRAASPLPAFAAPRNEYVDSRAEALRHLAGALRVDDVAVVTTGMMSRELFAEADRDATFYMMGSMGCAPAIALGIARCRPERRVVVIDGDGAFLMHMGIAATIGSHAPPGLLHVLVDNGTYDTTGGQPTASPTTAFEQIALASGYASATRAASARELGERVASFRTGDGPAFVALCIADGHRAGVPRVGLSPREIRDRVHRVLRIPSAEDHHGFA